jgi:hypothetical protein
MSSPVLCFQHATVRSPIVDKPGNKTGVIFCRGKERSLCSDAELARKELTPTINTYSTYSFLETTLSILNTTTLSTSLPLRAVTMTTYIPYLTLPSFIFEKPAISVLLPIAAGTAVGYSTRRE